MPTDRFPSLDDIDRGIDEFAGGHPDMARVESLGASPEGREVRAVHVTDPRVPAADKEVALVICGRHGQELGTRVVGLALLDWLGSANGEETRRRQLVIVVPVANPDGCVRGEFWAPTDQLSSTEKGTIARLAHVRQPDAVIDVHSWGEGLDGEAIVTGNTAESGEDVFIHESVAAKLTARAAAAGYPFQIHRTDRSGAYNNFYCGLCYEAFHSLVFGMEVNHHVLGPDDCAESGVAVLEAFLDAGNGRSPWEPDAGYPNRLLFGDFATSIRATGADRAARRKSRTEIWRNRGSFKALQREFLASQAIRVKAEYSGEPLPCGFALVCRTRVPPRSETVRVNGKSVEAATYRDRCSTYVSVEIHPSGKEEDEVLIEL